MASPRTIRRSVAFALLPIGLVLAGIPEPPVVLYGTVTIDGRRMTAANTDVLIVARVDGSPQRVGEYRMGDRPAIGDIYALPIRMETAVEGHPLADDAAEKGQSVDIYIRAGTGADQFVTSVLLESVGRFIETPLDVNVCNDTPGSSLLERYAAFQRCFTSIDGVAAVCCARFDIDSDGDVDLGDYQSFKP